MLSLGNQTGKCLLRQFLTPSGMLGRVTVQCRVQSDWVVPGVMLMTQGAGCSDPRAMRSADRSGRTNTNGTSRCWLHFFFQELRSAHGHGLAFNQQAPDWSMMLSECRRDHDVKNGAACISGIEVESIRLQRRDINRSTASTGGIQIVHRLHQRYRSSINRLHRRNTNRLSACIGGYHRITACLGGI